MPKYLVTLFKTFFSRLGYIFKLVWEAKPSMLFLMVFMSLFNGIMPVIGSMIGARILNTLAQVQSGAELAFSAITLLLILQFAYTFFNSAVSRVYSMITSISGELVSNHVKMKIMEKAKTVDMVSDEVIWSSSGFCGKKQPMPVGMGGPALRCKVMIGGR